MERSTWNETAFHASRRHHRELQVWQEGVALVRLVYEAAARLPSDERFALANQMRRAAVSIPCNIAEGAARGTAREIAHFLTIARGSLAELETQILIARDLEFLPSDHDLDEQLNRLFAKIANLMKRVKSRNEQ